VPILNGFLQFLLGNNNQIQIKNQEQLNYVLGQWSIKKFGNRGDYARVVPPLVLQLIPATKEHEEDHVKVDIYYEVYNEANQLQW
jgi:hypothetical protein